MAYEEFNSDNFIERYDNITGEYVLTGNKDKYDEELLKTYGENENTYYDNPRFDNVSENNEENENENGNTVTAFNNETPRSGWAAEDIEPDFMIGQPRVARAPVPPASSMQNQDPPPAPRMNIPPPRTEPRPEMPRPFPFIPRIIPIPVPRPVRPPNNNRAIRLSAEIYRQIKSLEETYRELIRLSGRFAAEEIERMLIGLRALEIPAFNIYRRLSGSNPPPFTGSMYEPLPRNYCAALRVTYNRVNNLYDDVLRLQRIVNIPGIDRQLIIMASVLQRHLSTLNRLLIDCIL